ncbi:MAG: MFS transporter [Anaerolineae bacterium]|nr:MFS transporter [Anaerolineae bacterium]
MAQPNGTFAQTFAPLKNRNFSLYFAGQGISLIGTFMQQVAQQWLIWDLSHDSRLIGVAGALAFLPMVFIGPITSSLADRVDRRKLLIITQIIDMLLAFSLALLVIFDVRSVWPVLVLAGLLGIVSSFTIPAQSAFIGDLSGMSEIRSAYTIYGMVIETARLVGPAIAGQVVALLGTATAFALNGLSFLAVIASLIMVRAQQKRQSSAKPNPLADFKESLIYMRHSPRMLDLLLCRLLVMLFIFSSLQLAAPIADQVLRGGPELVGNMFAASGAGALLGALVVAPQLQRMQRAGLGLSFTLIWSGIWLIITSSFTTPALTILGIFLYSVNIPVVLTNVASLTQVLSPPNMRARLSGASQMIASAAQPIGALMVGWLGNVLGPLTAIRVNGILMLTISLGLLIFSTGFRNWVPAPHTSES